MQHLHAELYRTYTMTILGLDWVLSNWYSEDTWLRCHIRTGNL